MLNIIELEKEQDILLEFLSKKSYAEKCNFTFEIKNYRYYFDIKDGYGISNATKRMLLRAMVRLFAFYPILYKHYNTYKKLREITTI